MVALILFTNMDIERRKNVVLPKETNSIYSAPNTKTEIKKDKSMFFINMESRRIVYVNKKGEVSHAPYTSQIFPPIFWDETIQQLRDRDELIEISRKEAIKVLTLRYEKLESELKDLKELILSIINDI